MAVTSRPAGAARGWAVRRGPGTRADTVRLRVFWLLAVALLLAGAIWGRLTYWQVLEHGSLSRLAARYQLDHRLLPATRGAIYDRDRNPLAVSTTVYDVTLTPTTVAVGDRARVADGLAGVLGVQRDDVTVLLTSGRSFAYVKKRQPKEVADRVMALGLPGVGLEAQPERTYFRGGSSDVTLASSLLGFVNYAGRGQQGVEQWYDQQLAGRNGSVVTYQDSLGREIALGNQKRRSAVNGADLTLTLDSSVQYAAEQAIADGVKAAHAQSGSVIVMDTKTGGIAAWASYPAYDSNHFATADPANRRDPLLADIYEPGSIMKVVTLAGAIDQGRITPTTTIQDPGYVVVSGQTLRDWDRVSHGTVTMTNVLELSLNVGAVRAQQAEGQDAFLRYLNAFGIGKTSGIDVSGETVAKLRSQWRPVELATAAYGQGVAVNMVQMCAAINVIANGGRWVEPHVVERIGDVLPSYPPPRPVVSPQTAATMTRMMQSVVQHGSGYTARVQGFEDNQAGKTGTSNMPDLKRGGYSDDVWASYVGFLPADNPRFTMLVVVRQPNNGSADHNEGYYVSGPIWKRIAEQIIPQWRITPGAVSPSN